MFEATHNHAAYRAGTVRVHTINDIGRCIDPTPSAEYEGDGELNSPT